MEPLQHRIKAGKDAGQQVEEEATRERFRGRPGPAELEAMGEITAEDADRMRATIATGPPRSPLRDLARDLRAERERQGLSLTDIAARSGIDRAAIHKIEIMVNKNPTMDTLERYAAALGKQLTIGVVDGPPAASRWAGDIGVTVPGDGGAAAGTGTGINPVGA